LADTILIADDDRATVQLIAGRLRQAGYQAVSAFDAMQAFMTAVKSPPAAILLDIAMPGGTGVEALKKLKTSTKTSGVPVIVISASSHPKLPQTVKDLGADEFLPKPIDFDKLNATLARVLGKEPTAPAK